MGSEIVQERNCQHCRVIMMSTLIMFVLLFHCVSLEPKVSIFHSPKC